MAAKLFALATIFASVLASPVALEKRTSGQATYYYQGGVAGSCGKVHSDSDLIIALSASYPGGVAAQCGKKATVTHAGKSVTATVADTCPECPAANIDMSVGAISKIDANYVNDGRIAVTWSVS